MSAVHPFPPQEPRFTQDPEFEARLDEKVLELRVYQEARRRLDAESRGEVEPFDAGLLGDVLAREPRPPSRIEGLIPSDASTLIVAMRKTGKTTLTLNLARSLLLGGQFLERFTVRPLTGRVGFLNYEVSAEMLARWASELQPAIPADRLYLVNVRGRRNPLDNEGDRARLADDLRAHEVEALIVDPFGRAFTGASQNDSAEVGAFLTQLDRFAREEAGVTDLVLTAHAGWEGERTRGASALEDWPDSIITMTRDSHDTTQRYLRAEGRDVLVEEDRLGFDEVTRTLRLTGAGSRRTTARTSRVVDLVPAVVEVVAANPGAGVGDVIKALRQTSLTFRDNEVSVALRSAVEQLRLRAEPGGLGRKTAHYLSNPVQPRPTHAVDAVNPTPSTPVQTPAMDAVNPTPSTPVYRDGVGVGGGSSEAANLGRGLCSCGTSTSANLPHLPGCSRRPIQVEVNGDE